MNRILIFVIVAVCMQCIESKPVDEPQIPIVRQSDDNDGNGNFAYSYEAGNGIQTEVQGQLKQLQVPGQEPVQAVVQQGRFSYVSPEGIPIEIVFIADENGFQPQGAHLPTPPTPLN